MLLPAFLTYSSITGPSIPSLVTCPPTTDTVGTAVLTPRSRADEYPIVSVDIVIKCGRPPLPRRNSIRLTCYSLMATPTMANCVAAV
jgi:hypothetical protein